MAADLETPVTMAVSDGVSVIKINRPKRLNALNLQVKRLLESFVRAAAQDPAVSIIVLTGSLTVFVAGTDIAEMRDMAPHDHGAQGTGDVFLALRACRKPLIAAVEGYALGGGCELALACDMIIAGAGARFGQPEIRVGIMPGAGGTQLLLRTIGKYRTMKLALTGDQLSAEEAFALGMVSEVVPEGRALDRANDLAATIRKMPPLAVLAIKRAIGEGQELPLTAALAHERELFVSLFASDDQKEGMDAFVQKRPPAYSGR